MYRPPPPTNHYLLTSTPPKLLAWSSLSSKMPPSSSAVELVFDLSLFVLYYALIDRNRVCVLTSLLWHCYCYYYVHLIARIHSITHIYRHLHTALASTQMKHQIIQFNEFHFAQPLSKFKNGDVDNNLVVFCVKILTRLSCQCFPKNWTYLFLFVDFVFTVCVIVSIFIRCRFIQLLRYSGSIFILLLCMFPLNGC